MKEYVENPVSTVNDTDLHADGCIYFIPGF